MKKIKDKINSKNLAIAGLLVVAVVLGILIRQKDSGGSAGTPFTPPGQNTGGGQIPVGERTFPENFTDEEKEVLDVPYSGTDEEKQKHFELAMRLLKDSESLDISGCFGTPVVMRVKASEGIKVVNNDSVDHTVIFDQNTSVVIPAGSSLDLKEVFSKGPGLYGYGCDLLPGVAGLFVVEN